MPGLFVMQLACTLCMTGLIWFVQVVHYPLFAEVPDTAFVRYEALHATRTGWLVFPPMVLEFGTALACLIPRYRPVLLLSEQACVGAVLVVVIWLSTGVIQVPLHNRLSRAHEPGVIRTLVRTNWLRTLAWTCRAALLLFALWRRL